MTQETVLNTPYGGRLINLLVAPKECAELQARAAALPRLRISPRNACDLELLATGGFSPLDRFMGAADYTRVLEEMRLANGPLFSIPITLPCDALPGLALDREIALADAQNELLAVMRVEEIFAWDKEKEARLAYGSEDPRHPLVAEMNSWGRSMISGPLSVVKLPSHYDFRSLRLTPQQVRRQLRKMGRANVVAFQTRNPLHRAHEEMMRRASREVDGTLLLHPVVGLTKPGDIDHFTRVRTYKSMVDHFADPDRIMLSLLPLAMRMAGPREALWHALIRRNFGASHLIVGRDHASPGLDSTGEPFYGPYAAQDLLAEHSAELGVQLVRFSELAYFPADDRYEEVSAVTAKDAVSLSATNIRENYLQQGLPVPAWYMRPEVSSILAQTSPPRHQQGFCVWFTGLGAAGKSTTAEILTVKLLETGRRVTVLDGDVVRTHLSKGLGFSKEDRDTNIRRIGFVAAEIARHGGAVICAAVSPHRATRNECRAMIGDERFMEVFVNTPLDVCEQRDTKGIYQQARAGRMQHVTGIDDIYEAPVQPEVELETVVSGAEENAARVFGYLVEKGFIRPQ
ncbi:MAG: sulfate adenylyltransferase [Blastocatellia bacterium]|jgi:sulfate adenylyltransferase|nr:sulfate adenylyltransferase [Blastocatellia bacterium]